MNAVATLHFNATVNNQQMSHNAGMAKQPGEECKVAWWRTHKLINTYWPK